MVKKNIFCDNSGVTACLDAQTGHYAAELEFDNPGYPVDGNVDMDFELFRGMVIGEGSNSEMEESRNLYQMVGGDSNYNENSDDE